MTEKTARRSAPTQRPHTHEPKCLARAYEDARYGMLDALTDAIGGVRGGSVLVVGAGGMGAVATLVADLHEAVTGHPARAISPLGLATASARARDFVVMTSSGARHPDAQAALRRLQVDWPGRSGSSRTARRRNSASSSTSGSPWRRCRRSRAATGSSQRPPSCRRWLRWPARTTSTACRRRSRRRRRSCRWAISSGS